LSAVVRQWLPLSARHVKDHGYLRPLEATARGLSSRAVPLDQSGAALYGLLGKWSHTLGFRATSPPSPAAIRRGRPRAHPRGGGREGPAAGRHPVDRRLDRAAMVGLRAVRVRDFVEVPMPTLVVQRAEPEGVATKTTKSGRSRRVPVADRVLPLVRSMAAGRGATLPCSSPPPDTGCTRRRSCAPSGGRPWRRAGGSTT
jgi:hypothetical protein